MRAVGQGLVTLLAGVAVAVCVTSGSPAGSYWSLSSSPSSLSAVPVNPDGLSPEQQARVTAALARMDRRAQVTQLFVVGVPLSDLAAGDRLAAGGVGGIFLAGRSKDSTGDLAARTRRWARAAPGVQPWVAADQEGGLVQALSGPGFAPLPSARRQGQLPPAERARVADGMGAALAAAGVTLDLAPVADIVPAGTAAANPPIGAVDRQYGSTAAEVVAAAGTVVRGLGAHGVTATLKHFPGLGSVHANTDTSAGVTDTAITATGDQVAAFGVLSRERAHPFVMVSAATYAAIDGSAQAMFSPVVIGRVLREQIGFRGVVITDDVGNAVAVQHVAPGDRAVRFLEAGGTLVLTVRAALLPTMVDAVLARDAADPEFARTLDAAVRTALVAKARAGLLPPA
jgi:beta-glucosidase-like glycosyl hydrolase